MSESEVAVKEPTNLVDTKECSMTAAEALAIAWTGIEELVRTNQAKLYQSQATGRVWIVLFETEYSAANGLVPLAAAKESNETTVGA